MFWIKEAKNGATLDVRFGEGAKLKNVPIMPHGLKGIFNSLYLVIGDMCFLEQILWLHELCR